LLACVANRLTKGSGGEPQTRGPRSCGGHSRGGRGLHSRFPAPRRRSSRVLLGHHLGAPPESCCLSARSGSAASGPRDVGRKEERRRHAPAEGAPRRAPRGPRAAPRRAWDRSSAARSAAAGVRRTQAEPTPHPGRADSAPLPKLSTTRFGSLPALKRPEIRGRDR
jgi:hypothetical protein